MRFVVPAAFVISSVVTPELVAGRRWRPVLRLPGARVRTPRAGVRRVAGG